MPFADLERRLRSLRNGEAANLVALPAIFCWLWSRADAPVNWALRLAALLALLYVLAQGGLYWHLKLCAVGAREDIPPRALALFRWFRGSNVVVVVGISVGAAVAGFSGQATSVDLVWTGGLVGFAVVEHVNYYSHQLAGGVVRWLRGQRLRRSALAVDLYNGVAE